MVPRSMTQLPGRRPRTRWGRPLHFRHGRSRRYSRDPGRHSSDTVWALVEKMLAGDADAAIVLSDVIDEGVSSGRTKFVKIVRPGYKQFGKHHPEQIQTGQFAAITPKRQIVLFGIRGTPHRGYKGYMSRYQIGDTAEYDSYNLVYFGEIIDISEKRVVFDTNAKYRQRLPSGEQGRYPVKKKVLNIYQFEWRNWDPKNLEDGVRRNREWND